MNILSQFLIIFVLCIIGETISNIMPFIIPSSVIAMLLLFVLIAFKFIKILDVRKSTDFMLKNISFFFIPSGVSIINYYSELSGYLLIFLIICIVATIATFVATAFTVIAVIRLQNRFTRGSDNV